MAVELETVHWVDSVFEEPGTTVPHFNYRIQSRETLGSSNLEVFVEEEVDGGGAARSSASSVTSPPAAIEEVEEEEEEGSSGSASSIGLKFRSAPRECVCVCD